jgi:hypothetical protein
MQIKINLVAELKEFLISSGVSLLIYPKVVKKMSKVDFFTTHMLSEEDFESAWDLFGLGHQVVYVSTVCYLHLNTY